MGKPLPKKSLEDLEKNPEVLETATPDSMPQVISTNSTSELITEAREPNVGAHEPITEADSEPDIVTTPEEKALALMGSLQQWLRAQCEAKGLPPRSLPVGEDDVVVSSILEIRTHDNVMVLRNELPFFGALSSSHLPELESDVLLTTEQMILRPLRSYLHKIAETRVIKSTQFRPEHALFEGTKAPQLQDLEKNMLPAHTPFDDDTGPAV